MNYNYGRTPERLIEEDQMEPEEAEFHIDASILKPNPYVKHVPTYDKVYEINGTLFYEQEPIEELDYKEFDINKLVKLCTDIDSGVHLQIDLKQTPHYVIINSAVYLSIEKWNTILTDEKKSVICAVCNCDVDQPFIHIYMWNHKENLTKYRPLKSFSLSIVRKIRNRYHCGVCNVLIKNKRLKRHFTIHEHQENYLTATRASNQHDLNHDNQLNHDSLNRKDGDTFQRKMNVKSCYRQRSHSCSNKSNVILKIEEENTKDSSYRRRNRSLGESFAADKTWDCIKYGVYDYENVHKLAKDETRDDIAKEDSNNNNKETKNKTYASVLKKNIHKLELNIDNQTVEIDFVSWHMILQCKPTEIYCMACKKMANINEMSRHCAEERHLNSIDNFKIIEEYSTCIIREIDDKFYHCGICNILQFIHSIDSHIKEYHPNIQLKQKKNIPNQDLPNIQSSNSDKLDPYSVYDHLPVLISKRHKLDKTKFSAPRDTASAANKSKSKAFIEKAPNGPEFNAPNESATIATHDTCIALNDAFNAPKENALISQNDSPCNAIKVSTNEAPHETLPKAINKTKADKTPCALTEANIAGFNGPKETSISAPRDITLNVQKESAPNSKKSPSSNAPHESRFDARSETIIAPIILSAEDDPMRKILFSDRIIVVFGQKVRIKNMAFHIITPQQNFFNCKICNFTADLKYIVWHILHDVVHIQKLHNIGFEPRLGVHMMRYVGYIFHCAICHTYVNVDLVHMHIMDKTHKSFLTKALETTVLSPYGIVTDEKQNLY